VVIGHLWALLSRGGVAFVLAHFLQFALSEVQKTKSHKNTSSGQNSPPNKEYVFNLCI
jgi:hypothetical protein